jgi:hypothetical protein
MENFKSQGEPTSYKPSEGEEFLMEFFRSEGIEFIFQKEINDLVRDNRSFRRADFYLPKYNVYVEFLGMWNVGEDKKNEYREKKAAYAQNNIPCLYFYPENLGIIHYSFNKRLRAVLKEHNRKKELYKYNSKLFMEDKSESIVGFIICFALLIMFQFDRKAGFYWQSCVVVGAFLIYLSYRIIKGYIKFFKEEYSYVTFVKE